MRKLFYASIALLMVAACQDRQQTFDTCMYVDSVVGKACIALHGPGHTTLPHAG